MSLLLLVNLYSYFLLSAVCCLLFIIICTRRTPCTLNIKNTEYCCKLMGSHKSFVILVSRTKYERTYIEYFRPKQ